MAAEKADQDAQRKTVAEVAERFLYAKQSLKWYPRYRQMLTYNLIAPDKTKAPDLHALGVGRKFADDLTAEDIEATLESIDRRGSPIQARRVYEVVRAMIRWANHPKQKGLMTRNPMDQVNEPANAKARSRFLSVDELRTVWNALCTWEAEPNTSPIPLATVQILMLQVLLAQRSGEIGGMRKHEIVANGSEWHLPGGNRTKNGKSHLVVLPKRAREIIAAAIDASDHPAYVFPVHSRIRGEGKAVDRSGYNAKSSDVIATEVAKIQNQFKFVDFEGNTAPFVAHDLRRTTATYLSKMGVASEIRDRILNHISDRSKSVEASNYNQGDMRPAMRKALTEWQAKLEDIADGFDPFAESFEEIEELERRLLIRSRAERRGKARMRAVSND